MELEALISEKFKMDFGDDILEGILRCFETSSKRRKV
jgi:hypothetical protein